MTGEIVLENGIYIAYTDLCEEVPGGYENRHQYEHCKAMELLDEMLLKHFNKSAGQLEIARKSGGKPYFVNSDIQFNLSHCRKRVVCAVSDKYMLGIDAEAIRNINESILRKVFSERERKAYEKKTDDVYRKEYFIKAWTFKESMAKLNGKGIGQDLRVFDYEEWSSGKERMKDATSLGTSDCSMQWIMDDNVIISLSYRMA